MDDITLSFTYDENTKMAALIYKGEKFKILGKHDCREDAKSAALDYLKEVGCDGNMNKSAS